MRGAPRAGAGALCSKFTGLTRATVFFLHTPYFGQLVSSATHFLKKRRLFCGGALTRVPNLRFNRAPFGDNALGRKLYANRRLFAREQGGRELQKPHNIAT